MATTALQLITSSMRLLGAVASGEAPTADEQADGLAVLNDLLDSMNNRGLAVYANTLSTFTLTAGRATYNIGPGLSSPHFAATRPVGIEKATVSVDSQDIPLSILTLEEWVNIPLKSTTAVYPYLLYYAPKYPDGEINLYPVPTANKVLTLSLNTPFAALASVGASIAYPPGYSKFLRYQLAIELAPEFKVGIPDDIREIARGEFEALQAVNIRPRYAAFDIAMIDFTAGTNSSYADFMRGF